MDDITCISHLRRGGLSAGFINDFSFDLFDKALAFSASSTSSSTDDTEEEQAVLVDFVLLLSQTVRPRELYLMAVEKLSSANIVMVDHFTLSLLYYALQLSAQPESTTGEATSSSSPTSSSSSSLISSLSLVIQSTCSRCTRARDDAIDEEDVGGGQSRIIQSIHLALAFYCSAAIKSTEFRYSSREARVWDSILGVSNDFRIGSGVSPVQEARIAFLLSLTAECISLLTANTIPGYVSLLSALLAREVSFDALFGFAYRARRFLIERKTASILSSPATQATRNLCAFSDLVWGPCLSQAGREVSRRHRTALARQIESVLDRTALQSWDVCLPWNLVSDDALRAALRLSATEEYSNSGMDMEVDGEDSNNGGRRSRRNKRRRATEEPTSLDRLGLSYSHLWSLLGLAMIAHQVLFVERHPLATQPPPTLASPAQACRSTYPHPFSPRSCVAHAFPYLLTLLQHRTFAQQGLELASVIAAAADGLRGRLLFVPSLAVQVEGGDADPLVCLAGATASTRGNQASAFDDDVNPLCAAAAHALSADTLIILQAVSQVLAAAHNETLRDLGVATLRGLLGCMDEGSRYAVLVRLIVGESGEGQGEREGCPYESVRGLLLDYVSFSVQAASKRGFSGLAPLKDSSALPALTSLSAAEANLCIEAQRLEYLIAGTQDQSRSLFWSPFFVTDLVLPVLAPFSRSGGTTAVPVLLPQPTASSVVYKDAQLEALSSLQQGVRAVLGLLQFLVLRLKLNAAAVPLTLQDLHPDTLKLSLTNLVRIGIGSARGTGKSAENEDEDLGLALVLMNAQRVLEILESL